MSLAIEAHELSKRYRIGQMQAAYGTLRVTADGDRLRLSWAGYDGPLTHFHLDTFTLEGTGEPGGEQALFDLRPDGGVGAVRFLGRTFRRRE